MIIVLYRCMHPGYVVQRGPQMQAGMDDDGWIWVKCSTPDVK